MYDDLTREVEQFLYREARLLDERRCHLTVYCIFIVYRSRGETEQDF